jgi:hypothetical protein
MSNSQINLLREQIKSAHNFLEGALQDVTAETAHWQPQGLAKPIAAHFAHVVVIEDAIVNAVLKGNAPLFMAGYANRTGLSELPPLPTPDSPGLPNWHEWGRRLELDLGATRIYAQAVYAATEAYLDTLTEDDLQRKVQSALGETTVSGLLSTAISNCHWHTGEISCLKGLQNLKGYVI